MAVYELPQSNLMGATLSCAPYTPSHATKPTQHACVAGLMSVTHPDALALASLKGLISLEAISFGAILFVLEAG